MNQPANNSSLWRTAIFCLVMACHAQTSHADRADRDKPMHLEADQVLVDDSRQISTFEGNVQFTQGTMIIRGDKIVVTQDKGGFSRGIATGQPASFRQKREESEEYVEGYGERIEYDSQNESLDLVGNARMKMGQDEVNGEHITYSSRTEFFQVHGAQMDASGKPADKQGKGRVRAIIQPKRDAATQSGTESLPIKQTGKLNKPENNR